MAIIRIFVRPIRSWSESVDQDFRPSHLNKWKQIKTDCIRNVIDHMIDCCDTQHGTSSVHTRTDCTSRQRKRVYNEHFRTRRRERTLVSMCTWLARGCRRIENNIWISYCSQGRPEGGRGVVTIPRFTSPACFGINSLILSNYRRKICNISIIGIRISYTKQLF